MPVLKASSFRLVVAAVISTLAGCGGSGKDSEKNSSASEPNIYASLLVDVNGDSKPDLLRGGGDFIADSLLINDGTGHFPSSSLRYLPPHYLGKNGHSIQFVAIDVEGDGDNDVISVIADARPENFYKTSQIHLFINDGLGNFSDGSSRLPGGGFFDTWPAAIVVGDFDGDGFSDILLSGGAPIGDIIAPAGGTIWLNNRSGKFAKASIELPSGVPELPTDGDEPPIGYPSAWVVAERLQWFSEGSENLVSANVDADTHGMPDVVSISDRITFRNLSTPGHLKFEHIRSQCAQEMTQGALIDYSGDGLPDLIAAELAVVHGFTGHKTTPIAVCLNAGSGRFIDDTAHALSGVTVGVVHPRQMIAADFDNDGDKDVYIADHGYDADPFPGQPNTLLRNNGNGTLTDASMGLSRKNTYTHGASAGDVDGNGLIDLFENNSWTGLTLFINKGGLVFEGRKLE